jgi:DNA-binding MarR family transcriptional regulator
MTAAEHRGEGFRTQTDDWSDDQRSIGGLLQLALRLVVADFHERLAEAGYPDVRPGSGNVFEHIGREGSTVAAMATRAGITAQAMVQTVDYLESRGYVERTPVPTDRRAKLVRLTERGEEANRTARECLETIEGEWSQVLGADRFGAFRETLAALVSTIERRR